MSPSLAWPAVFYTPYARKLELSHLDDLLSECPLWALCLRHPSVCHHLPVPEKPEERTAAGQSILRTFPKVTMQLPIFNEVYVVERLLRSVSEIDYPRELLQIQVLDDSTDDTREITASVAEELQRSRFQCRAHSSGEPRRVQGRRARGRARVRPRGILSAFWMRTLFRRRICFERRSIFLPIRRSA